MSILKTALANVSPSLPKAQAKVFAAFKIEPFVHSLIFGKGLSHADTITPSAIGMNAHAAKSALGGAVNVPGFITGLCWSLCALAHGQKKLAALQEGLPAASAYALEHGSSLFKPGAGISAGSLETVVLASLKAMLALPAPAKRVTAAAEDPTVVAARAESASKAEAERRAAAEAAEAAAAAEAAEAAEAARLPSLRLLPRLPRLPRLRLLPRLRMLPSEAAAEAADAAAAQSYVRAVTSLPRDEAEQQLRAIALALGFRLVRIKAA
jgi:hypothetical protein